MARGRKPKNPADFGKQFEELKHKVVKDVLVFCKNPNNETEEKLYKRSRELGRAMAEGMELAVKSNITTDELIAKIKQTLVAVCRFCSSDIQISPETIVRYFNGGNASVEITYGTSDNYKHFKIKYRESDTAKFAELVEALKEWREK